ncbi:MAG: CDP-diacylglycerol--glycerol-3-phosphate 3-phosphatidyltransferase [Clostridia bacterium]
MNLANKLTLLRIAMIPFFIAVMLTNFGGEYSNWIAFGIFLVASITDKIDGTIARKYNMITNFGKFMDPIADKLLVASALICLLQTGKVSVLVVLIILGRELIISGFRLVAVDNGEIIAASVSGKIKTVAQMTMICLLLADLEILSIVTLITVIIAVITTITSMIEYMYKNKSVLTDC